MTEIALFNPGVNTSFKISMQIITHLLNEHKIAEVVASEVIIRSPEDALQLLGDCYYQGFDGIIIYAECLTPDFFDLKNGIAGEILQKFSNYRMQLAIIGDFSLYMSKSIKAFMSESNQGRQVLFAATLDDALSFFHSQ